MFSLRRKGTEAVPGPWAPGMKKLIRTSCCVCGKELFKAQNLSLAVCSKKCRNVSPKPVIGDLAYETAEFWARVDKTPGQGPGGDCWVWLGSYRKNDYGRFYSSIAGKSLQVTRYSLNLCRPTKDESLFACHTCDYPPCLNPEHLFWGTGKENSNDAYDKGRMVKGSESYCAKLTESQAKDIKYNLGHLSNQKVAESYGLAKTTVAQIRRGKRWRHI